MILASVIIFFLSPQSQAAPIFVANPSFEAPATASATFTGGQTFGPNNWTVYNTVAASNQRYFGVWNPTTTASYFDPTPDGINIGVVFLDSSGTFQEAGLQQTLAATLAAFLAVRLVGRGGQLRAQRGRSLGFYRLPRLSRRIVGRRRVLAGTTTHSRPPKVASSHPTFSSLRATATQTPGKLDHSPHQLERHWRRSEFRRCAIDRVHAAFCRRCQRRQDRRLHRSGHPI